MNWTPTSTGVCSKDFWRSLVEKVCARIHSADELNWSLVKGHVTRGVSSLRFTYVFFLTLSLFGWLALDSCRRTPSWPWIPSCTSPNKWARPGEPSCPVFSRPWTLVSRLTPTVTRVTNTFNTTVSWQRRFYAQIWAAMVVPGMGSRIDATFGSSASGLMLCPVCKPCAVQLTMQVNSHGLGMDEFFTRKCSSWFPVYKWFIEWVLKAAYLRNIPVRMWSIVRWPKTTRKTCPG